MKRFAIIAALLLAACGVSAQVMKFHKNCVVAHRGAWKEHKIPQNSLASFRAAAEMGCHGSECDVHLTADDSLIVTHDVSYHGMVLKNTKYADLVAIPLKNGEKMPTLREYLAFVMKQNRTKLIIDVKNIMPDEHATKIATETARVVKEMKAEPWVEYLVCNEVATEAMKGLTNCRMAYLGRYRKEVPNMHPDSVRSMGLDAVDYQNLHFYAHPEWIKTFKRRGVHLNAWTINEEEDMDWFIKRKFDYITTDYPEKLLRKLKYKAK